jgi:hypothetical protein
MASELVRNSGDRRSVFIEGGVGKGLASPFRPGDPTLYSPTRGVFSEECTVFCNSFSYCRLFVILLAFEN